MKAASLTSRNLTADIHSRRAPLLADSVFGMLIFVATEVMFFTALISAFVIIKAGVEPWTPPVGVRLPVGRHGIEHRSPVPEWSIPPPGWPPVRRRGPYPVGADPPRWRRVIGRVLCRLPGI